MYSKALFSKYRLCGGMSFPCSRSVPENVSIHASKVKRILCLCIDRMNEVVDSGFMGFWVSICWILARGRFFGQLRAFFVAEL